MDYLGVQLSWLLGQKKENVKQPQIIFAVIFQMCSLGSP